MKYQFTGQIILLAMFLLVLPPPLMAELVTDYGAVCDGHADDTLSISQALAAANPVEFPPGAICRVRGVVLDHRTDVTIHGHRAMLKLLPGILTPATDLAVLRLRNAVGIEVRDLVLHGNRDENPGASEFNAGLTLERCRDCWAVNLTTLNTAGDGILVYEGSERYVLLHNVILDPNVANGVGADRQGIAVTDARLGVIAGNVLQLARGRMNWAIDLEPTVTAGRTVVDTFVMFNAIRDGWVEWLAAYENVQGTRAWANDPNGIPTGPAAGIVWDLSGAGSPIPVGRVPSMPALVWPRNLDFGVCPVGQRCQMALMVRNGGAHDVTILQVPPLVPPFSKPNIEGTPVVSPGYEYLLTMIVFTPTIGGSVTSRLAITTTEGSVVIVLTGVGQ